MIGELVNVWHNSSFPRKTIFLIQFRNMPQRKQAQSNDNGAENTKNREQRKLRIKTSKKIAILPKIPNIQSMKLKASY